MASTPSASALSAVLRCRGNLWSRNPPTKRPQSAGYSRGLTAAALREAPGDRHQLSARWGERGLTVAYTSRKKETEEEEEEEDEEEEEEEEEEEDEEDATTRRTHAFSDKSCLSKLCRGHARPSAPGVESALAVRSLTHKVKSKLPVIHGCSRMIRGLEPQTYAAHVCQRIPQGRGCPAGVVKVSFTTPSLNSGHVCVVLTGSKSPRAPLLSQLVDLKAVVLWRSDDGPQHVLEENHTNTDDLQEHGQTPSPTCPQRVTEDTPD